MIGGGDSKRGGDDAGRHRRVVLIGLAVVLVVGLGLLYGVTGNAQHVSDARPTGIVTVVSDTMEPGIERGDVVFLGETNGNPTSEVDSQNGIVTAARGQSTDYRTFEGYGDVIVFWPDGVREGTPVIHRPMFWVEAGENWVAKANQSYLRGIESCADIDDCPAPHDGYVTKGDANPVYDQATYVSTIVRAEWIIGTAEWSRP